MTLDMLNVMLAVSEEGMIEEMLLAAEYAEPSLHDVTPPPLPFRGQHVAAFEQQRHRHLRLPALMGDPGHLTACHFPGPLTADEIARAQVAEPA